MDWRRNNICMEEKKDYSSYRFCAKDWTLFLMKLGIKALIICYLFYDSIIGILLWFPFVFFDYKTMKRDCIQKQKEKITDQFKAMAEALVTSLSAGYSLEHAFKDAKRDLSLVYEKKEDIFCELNLILDGIYKNMPIEVLIKDFGLRSGIQDIRNFANVITVAKKNGGNLIHIIEKTVKNISEQLSVEKEIKTIIAEKKLEEKIMMLMPYGIIFYLRVTNGDFMKVLYHNLFGTILMTMFLIMLYVADFWARKVMDIQV